MPADNRTAKRTCRRAVAAISWRPSPLALVLMRSGGQAVGNTKAAITASGATRIATATTAAEPERWRGVEESEQGAGRPDEEERGRAVQRKEHPDRAGGHE